MKENLRDVVFLLRRDGAEGLYLRRVRVHREASPGRYRTVRRLPQKRSQVSDASHYTLLLFFSGTKYTKINSPRTSPNIRGYDNAVFIPKTWHLAFKFVPKMYRLHQSFVPKM